MKRKIDLITRMLAAVSPKRAYHRLAWKNAYERAFYSASDRSPRSAGWTTSNLTGEMANQNEREIVRARSRDLERNSDILNAQILAFERNVVGTGIVLQAKVLTADGNEDDAVNEQIEAAWKEWCKPENCEITGRFSLAEIERMIVRRRLVDGGILLLKVYSQGKFQLQLIEVDDLDTTLTDCGGRQVIGGIEVDEYHRAVAYHIKKYDSWGYCRGTERISAERILYLPNLTRPSQIREFSLLAASLPRIDDANELIDAAIEKERVLAHFSAVIESDGGPVSGGLLGRGLGFSLDEDAQTQDAVPAEVLEQGSITYLKPGESVKTVGPAGTSAVVDPLLRSVQRLSGGGLGLSYEVASRDMSQVTYSSARQGLLEDQRTYRMMQIYLVEHFCDRIYEDWLNWAVLDGRLNLPGYLEKQKRYQKHVWISAGWDWIDPLKEANANRIALESSQTTLQEICASKGRDYKDILRQRAAEIKMMERLVGEQDAEKE